MDRAKLISILTFLALSLFPQSGFGYLSPVSARDEATCIFEMAKNGILTSRWRHLRLEPVIFFRQHLVVGEREYTIFASSQRNTPRNYKVKFEARWSVEGSRCEPAGETENGNGLRVMSSQGHRVLVVTRDGGEEIDPAELPLDPREERPDTAGFTMERGYGGGGTVEGTPGSSPMAPAFRLTFDRRSIDILREQGVTVGAEAVGFVGLRFFRPASRGLRLVRRVGRAGLFLDASSRVYFVVGEGIDPGIIALPRAASQVLPQVWDRLANQLVVTGSMRVPASYLEQFYQRP